MRKLVIAISTLALTATAVFAGPIEDRKALMKANGAAIGQLNKYVKGETPFDAAGVLEQLTRLSDDAAQMDFATLWPEDSKTGDTTSSPKIWEDRAGFQAAIDKFRADTASAVAAAPQDVDALKIEFGKVAANCGGCHQAYRVSKN